jgi:tetratricopeptide (TPR) repeat protein
MKDKGNRCASGKKCRVALFFEGMEMTRTVAALVLGLSLLSGTALAEEENPYDEAFKLYTQKRYKEAEEAYRRALEENPESIGVNLELGRLLRETGRPHESLPFLQKAFKLAPRMHAAAAELGTAQMALKDWLSAAKHLALGVKLNPKDAITRWRLGYVQYRQDELDKAEKTLKKAVDLDENLSTAWLDLGLVQREKGEGKEALRSFRTAVETDPFSGVAFKEYAKAVDDCGEMKERLLVKGWKEHNEGRYEDAEATVRKLLVDGPHDVRSHLLMGHIQLHRTPPRLVRAIDAYRNALAYDKKASRAERLPMRSKSFGLEGLGIALLSSGELKEAEKTFSQGSKLDKSYPGHFYYLAVLAARDGKLPKVLKRLVDVRQRDTDGSWVKRAWKDEEFEACNKKREFYTALTGEK